MKRLCDKFSDDEVRKKLDGASVSAGTRQVYLGAMRRAQSVMGGMSVCEILARPNQSFALLEDALRPKSAQTLATTIGGLLGVMKHVGMREDKEHGGIAARFGKRWQAMYQPLMKELDERRLAGTPSERQEAGAVSWLAVVKKNEALSDAGMKRTATGEDIQDALLSSFYVDMEPRRQGDYHRVYVMMTEGGRAAAEAEPSHIDMTLKKPVIVVKEHKTARGGGPWTAVLPSTTVKLLRRRMSRKGASSYVFAREDGKPYTTKGFTYYHNRKLREWFGGAVSNNSLRHARASVIQSDFTMTSGEKDAAALAMGHTPGMNKRYAYRPVVMDGDKVEIVGRRRADGRLVVYECKPK
jgi:hypothetical protein